MTDRIIVKIAELSETENLTSATKIEDLNMWDSLAIISLMIFAKNELGTKFNNMEKLETAQTVGEICDLLVNFKD